MKELGGIVETKRGVGMGHWPMGGIYTWPRTQKGKIALIDCTLFF